MPQVAALRDELHWLREALNDAIVFTPAPTDDERRDDEQKREVLVQSVADRFDVDVTDKRRATGKVVRDDGRGEGSDRAVPTRMNRSATCSSPSGASG